MINEKRPIEATSQHGSYFLIQLHHILLSLVRVYAKRGFPPIRLCQSFYRPGRRAMDYRFSDYILADVVIDYNPDLLEVRVIYRYDQHALENN